MTRNTWFRIVIPCISYGVFGLWVGATLTRHHGLVTYKIFNVVGYILAMLGMVVLSQLVVQNTRYKAFILKHLSGQFLLFLIISGGVLMLYSLHWANGPSAAAMEDFGPRFFFFFVMPSMLFINFGVGDGDNTLPWSDETRYTVFGAYLAGAGMVLQIYAAICDLLA